VWIIPCHPSASFLVTRQMSCGGYPYPVSHNYFDTVKHIVEGPLPTENPQIQSFVAPDLLQMIHTSIDKDPNLRPDVLALLRHPFIARHQVAPVDLRGYLETLETAGGHSDEMMMG